MNRSIDFLQAIHSLWERSVPEKVMIRARRSLLDYLAVTCAGVRFQQDKLARYWAFLQPEEGKFRAIGMRQDVALKEAVFLNGLNAHALDFDDGTNSGIIHLGSPIFSLLFPLAQRYGISLEDMLKAAVIGYETSYTLAVSIQPVHKALGYHATGTCGVIGATVAAGYMLGFSEAERTRSFAAACMAASGMLKALDEGSELKPYNVAKSSLLALTSLQLGKAGFQGPEDPLGGRGFLKMMTGREDTEIKEILLGGTYAIEKSYTKPYASCRYTHPAVEAAIRLGKKIRAEDVRQILVRTYGLAVPGHDHKDVAGSYSAKMSIPYAVAVAFLFGKAGLQEFEESTIGNKSVQRLTSLVEVEEDEALSLVFPAIQAAIVTVGTVQGEMTERVDYPKGEPENPLNETEFKERYDALMEYGGVSASVREEIFCLTGKKKTAAAALVEKL